jgi:hypothetical protein
MSEQLEALCTADGIETPSHILAKFRVNDPIPDHPVPDNELLMEMGGKQSLGLASNMAASETIPSYSESMETEMGMDTDKIAKLSTRRTAQRTKAETRTRSFSLQSMTQMAAALVLGIFVGPQLFQLTGPKSGLDDVGSIHLRSGESLAAINEQSPTNLVSLLALSDQGIFDHRIEPGGAIPAGKPFVLQLNAPLNGIVRVYDITRTSGGDTSSGDNQASIYEGEVTSGDRFALPQKGAFRLSDEKQFSLAVVFEGDGETHEAQLDFFVE